MPHADDRPVGSDAIHASIAHGNAYDEDALPAFAQKNKASRPTLRVRTELHTDVVGSAEPAADPRRCWRCMTLQTARVGPSNHAGRNELGVRSRNRSLRRTMTRSPAAFAGLRSFTAPPVAGLHRPDLSLVIAVNGDSHQPGTLPLHGVDSPFVRDPVHTCPQIVTRMRRACAPDDSTCPDWWPLLAVAPPQRTPQKRLGDACSPTLCVALTLGTGPAPADLLLEAGKG